MRPKSSPHHHRTRTELECIVVGEPYRKQSYPTEEIGWRLFTVTDAFSKSRIHTDGDRRVSWTLNLSYDQGDDLRHYVRFYEGGLPKANHFLTFLGLVEVGATKYCKPSETLGKQIWGKLYMRKNGSRYIAFWFPYTGPGQERIME